MLGPRPDYCLHLNFLNFTTLVEDGNLGGGLRVENGEKGRTGQVSTGNIIYTLYCYHYLVCNYPLMQKGKPFLSMLV